MSNVKFISDLHLGHKNILKFSSQWRGGTTIEEHDDWVIERCNSVLFKRDVLYILGDIAFSREALTRLREIKGQKFLILGNHDKYTVQEYSEYGVVRPGIFGYKRLWLSHCPIHPQELRGRPNVHGHVHHNTIPDDRYINVSVEARLGVPICLDEIRELQKKDNNNDKERQVIRGL